MNIGNIYIYMLIYVRRVGQYRICIKNLENKKNSGQDDEDSDENDATTWWKANETDAPI